MGGLEQSVPSRGWSDFRRVVTAWWFNAFVLPLGDGTIAFLVAATGKLQSGSWATAGLWGLAGVVGGAAFLYLWALVFSTIAAPFRQLREVRAEVASLRAKASEPTVNPKAVSEHLGSLQARFMSCKQAVHLSWTLGPSLRRLVPLASEDSIEAKARLLSLLRAMGGNWPNPSEATRFTQMVGEIEAVWSRGNVEEVEATLQELCDQAGAMEIVSPPDRS